MFSLTTELVSGWLTTLGPIEVVPDAGATDRIEIDGPQHFRTLPVSHDDEVEGFSDLVAQRELRLSMIGIADHHLATRCGELFSLGEPERFVGAQIAGAARLGLPTTRIVFATAPALIERMLSCAAPYGVTVPQVPQVPQVPGASWPGSPVCEAGSTEIYDLGSDRLGLVFDLSACVADLPISFLEKPQGVGVPRSVVDSHHEACAYEDVETHRAIIERRTAGVRLWLAARGRLATSLARFANSRVAGWRHEWWPGSGITTSLRHRAVCDNALPGAA